MKDPKRKFVSPRSQAKAPNQKIRMPTCPSRLLEKHTEGHIGTSIFLCHSVIGDSTLVNCRSLGAPAAPIWNIVGLDIGRPGLDFMTAICFADIPSPRMFFFAAIVMFELSLICSVVDLEAWRHCSLNFWSPRPEREHTSCPEQFDSLEYTNFHISFAVISVIFLARIFIFGRSMYRL